MKFRSHLAALAAILLASAPGFASTISGTTVNFSTSATGTTTITGSGSSTVPASFSFCVGPNQDNCVGSGLYGAVNISDTKLSVTFWGGTLPATGTFNVDFTGFGGMLQTVTPEAVNSPVSGGTFGLSMFNSSEILLTGIMDNAMSGSASTYAFDLNQASDTPEPDSMMLCGLGAAAIGYFSMRKRQQ